MINLPYLLNKNNVFPCRRDCTYAVPTEEVMQCPCCASYYTLSEPCLCLPPNCFEAMLRSAKAELVTGDIGTEWSPLNSPAPLWLLPIGEA